MKTIGLAIVAALAFVPMVANAHGPTRQKVTITQDVAAPPAEVWAYIGDFQDMSWHPAVHKTDGSNGDEKARHRPDRIYRCHQFPAANFSATAASPASYTAVTAAFAASSFRSSGGSLFG